MLYLSGASIQYVSGEFFAAALHGYQRSGTLLPVGFLYPDSKAYPIYVTAVIIAMRASLLQDGQLVVGAVPPRRFFWFLS